MSVSSIDWSVVTGQECTTQCQYMRHRFLRTLQKYSPWLAVASIVSVLLGFPLTDLHHTFELSVLQSLSYLMFVGVSLSVIHDAKRAHPLVGWLIGGVLVGYLLQAYWLLSSHASFTHIVSLNSFSQVVSAGQIATDVSMSLLVVAGFLLCHFQCNRASQAVLIVALLMPVTGLLARAYGIPDAYGQLSMLSCLAGLLSASALLAKQVSQTSISYLLLMDESGRHLRWIVSLLFLCAIFLGGVGVYFKNDYRLTPLIITLSLICVVSIMTFTYYRKGVTHEQVLPPEDLAFASELEAAIAHQEFYLVYQPQLNFMTGELVGVEALIRWQHPQQGVVSPAKFIGVAELTGLIVPMGAWVLKAACQQVASWQTGALSKVKVSVNVSPMQLRSPGFTDYVLQVLRDTGLSADRLVIELTESALIHSDCKGTDSLQALKQLGVKLAIDDFGTGYSCLAYLRDIPGDYLKVDRSFVNDVPGKERSEAVTSAIVVLGKNLHYQIVAEGVETEAQAEYLKSLGCDLVQGYLYAKPMPEQALQQWVNARPA
jgi:EAL domain-containing protein (putative c-di-GMP-specific phosphodiesterase class I)